MTIRLDRYRVLLKVAETLNMSQAAEALCLTRSAVSHAIKGLEADFGVPLFTRASTQLKLTQEGSWLLARIEQPIRILAETEQNFRHEFGGAKRRIRMATTHTLLKTFLLPHVDTLSAQTQNTEISFSTGSIRQAILAVEEDQADIALVAAPPSTFDGTPYESIDLMPLHEVFIGPEGVAPPAHLTPETLASQALVTLPRDSVSFARYQAYFEANGSHLTPKIEVHQMDLIFELVKKEVGIGIVYREILGTNPAAGTIEWPVSPSIDPVQLTLLWREKSEIGRKVSSSLRQIFLNSM